MTVVNQVLDLKNKGVPESEIVNQLKGQGVSPKDITYALDQAKIKKAVSAEESSENVGDSTMKQEENQEGSGGEYVPAPGGSGQEGYMPSMQEEGGNYQSQQELYAPSSEAYIPQEQYPSQGYDQQYDAQYGAQPQDYYQQSQGYPQGGGADTMIEIAEQVFSEKVKKIQKQVEDFNEFKNLAQSKIENISDRLKRIESNIDRLQAEILEKVGSYGRGIEGIQKEMSMMQDSFGKVVNNLIDKTDEKQKHSYKKK